MESHVSAVGRLDRNIRVGRISRGKPNVKEEIADQIAEYCVDQTDEQLSSEEVWVKIVRLNLKKEPPWGGGTEWPPSRAK